MWMFTTYFLLWLSGFDFTYSRDWTEYNYTSPETCNASFPGPSLASMCNDTSYDLFLSILETFVGRKQEIAQTCERITPIHTPDAEYDFIVVGGGAAGSVVAARLSENSSWKVLLVEAGPEEPVGASVPGFSFLISESSIEWGYQSTNESYACLSSNGSCQISAAKALGGSMMHNDMDEMLYTVNASKEVILSAGAVESPHLLLLSGVGPEEDLKSMGIDVVHDLPGVGMNFHDHLLFPIALTINELDVYNNWAALAEYIGFQTGPMSSTELGQVIGALPSGITTPDLPDIHIYGYGYTAACVADWIGDGQREINFWAGYEHPKCRGRISLASSDPFEHPSIWVNYLCDPDDVSGVVKAIEYSLELVNTTALKAYNTTFTATPLEVCSNYTFASTEYWECAVHYSASGEFHIAGSCKMGPSSDLLAVVDPRLRVYGIQGLRVADASIMPQVTSANIGSTCVMIGERAAHMIKQDWNYTDAM
ncbi:glucose dehydrogenase [FAD, quinone] isoform X2 [Neodiprion lecontei]|uniref:Glucose dehydrogenase [FAD, quinone] isoform X2 n=1 Tax=Neodiprion lecontei TaxID=441921 RepID=A0ABM3GC79_NEOLC|nr:glucose dehydrogenase [FAD, quinone] isoform X2 [Neodiprion lecontei]